MPGTTMRRSEVAAYSFVALCACLIALHFLLPRGELPQAMTYFSVGFVSFLAVVAGILLNRPSRTVHLWLLAAGLALLSLGDAIWIAYDRVLEIERPFPSVADWAYLAGHLAILGAFLLLLRSRQKPTLSDVLDGAIVLLGSSLLLWLALMKPAATDAALTPAARVVSTAYPAADVLLLVVLAQLVLVPGARSFAYRALGLGAAVLFAADVVYGAEALAGTYEDGGWVHAGWMISPMLWGAAVLHPSIRGLHERTPLRSVTLTQVRLALLAAAALVTPLAIILYRNGDGLDSALIAGAAAFTTLFIFARMALLFREHEQAVAALREAETARALEETSRIANERFQGAARALECAIYEWEPSRDRIAWSDGLSVAFGYPSDLVDSSNTWFLEHVHPEDRESVAATLQRVAAGEPTGQSSYRFRAGDGTYRHVLDRWSVRRNEAGEVQGVVGGMVDVTESRELEQQLRQAQKMEAVGRLAGGVAHDFNNLLTAIAGNAELLAQSRALGPEEQADVAEIRRAAANAAELTRRLLAFNRSAGETLATVQLNDAVEEAGSFLRRLIRRDVKIVQSLDEGVGAVLCDPAGVEQIVVNLVLNARDAMPAGGVIRISTAAEDGTALLAVVDEGVGMDADTAARAFEPFFTTKEVGQGTGLGLSTVYGIVERAGGSVEISSAPGAGTRVAVRLPRVELPEDEPSSHDRLERGSETLLLVEDEAVVREVVARMLRSHGYEVVEAENALDALEQLGDETFRPDLVVSDLVMPGLTGTELAARVGELRPGLRFLFISGYSESAPAELPLVPKPFTSAELARAVRDALAAPAQV